MAQAKLCGGSSFVQGKPVGNIAMSGRTDQYVLQR